MPHLSKSLVKRSGIKYIDSTKGERGRERNLVSDKIPLMRMIYRDAQICKIWPNLATIQILSMAIFTRAECKMDNDQ